MRFWQAFPEFPKDRIVDASSPAVIAAYEERIAKLEKDKLVCRERMQKYGQTAAHVRQDVRTRHDFPLKPVQNMGFRHAGPATHRPQTGLRGGNRPVTPLLYFRER
ncbi:MAG: hypothetical protein EOM20_19710 [Spartobacteria bacterium]|nr:hypothetical protein [Spartobacteria bacterium]